MPSNNRSIHSANPRFFALIPCGGVGSRASLASEPPAARGVATAMLPKQYHALAGQPMVAHTLAAFAGVPRLAQVLTVIAADDKHFAYLLSAMYSVAYKAGSTRALTVFNGLQHLLEQGAGTQDWVLVHDAARCLITTHQINALIDACQHDAVGGLLALPLPDTLKTATPDGTVASTLPRADKWLAQTPQMFRIGPLMEALSKAGDAVTDESSAMEALGLQPRLIPGSSQNFKVTYPEDFALAEAVLKAR